MKSILKAVLFILLGMVFASAIFLISNGRADSTEKWSQPEVVQAAERINEPAQTVHESRKNAITRAVKRASPAVVGINVTAVQSFYQSSPFANDPFFRHFFPRYRVMREVESLGSGFIFSKDGLVLTNQHVINNAREIIVTTPGGEQYEAEVVGQDTKTDIAVLRIEGDDFPVVEFGDSEDVIIGEWVIALGNPFGLFDVSAKPTVTVGVISATDQDFGLNGERLYEDMIQTDAAINSGNSGGPLVNAEGVVIGINAFIYSGSATAGTSIGLGFAIPINRVKEILNDLVEKGEVDRSFWTGIQYDEITPTLAYYLGLKSTDGVIITEVEPNSPAAKAGLEIRDVILEINDQKIRNGNDVKTIIQSSDLRQGDSLQLRINRDGKIGEVEIELAPYPKTKL